MTEYTQDIHMYRVDMQVTLFTTEAPTPNIEVKIRDALGTAGIKCSLGTVKVESVGEVQYKGGYD